MNPLDELDALFAEDTQPSLRILWAFPLLFPGCWHGVFEKLCSFRLNLRSKHFSTLEHFLDTNNTFVDKSKNFLDRDHLHIHELVYGIRCFELFSTNTN